MATQRIQWKASTAPNVTGYEVLVSESGVGGPYEVLTTVLHQIPGTHYITESASFFFDDELIPYRWYRVRVVDQFGNKAEDEYPSPFQAGNDPVEVPTLYTTKLDQDFGTPNAYQYVTQNGDPINEATVRVYTKINWDTQNTSIVVGITKTDADGAWVTPIPVTPGETYVIVYHKENEYGPDTVEITV